MILDPRFKCLGTPTVAVLVHVLLRFQVHSWVPFAGTFYIGDLELLDNMKLEARNFVLETNHSNQQLLR